MFQLNQKTGIAVVVTNLEKRLLKIQVELKVQEGKVTWLPCTLCDRIAMQQCQPTHVVEHTQAYICIHA